MSPNAYDRTYTREELEAQADELARNSSLRTTGREAWRRVQAGELEGTFLASKLARLFFLIDHSKPTPMAAE
jgi:hypothetical protein